MSPKGQEIVPIFGNLFTNEPLPVDGWITLNNKPGFGLEINEKEFRL